MFVSPKDIEKVKDMSKKDVNKYPEIQLDRELPTVQLPLKKVAKKSGPKSLFTDEEVAFALDPKEGKVVIDKNGNFYNKSTGITYKRDPKNPDILHAHNPRNGKQKENITLKESEDGALVLQSSTGLKRIFNNDWSFREQFQAGTIKKPFDIDSKNPLEYSHEETHSYDKKGTRIKSLFKFIDGSTIEISAQKYLYRRPDGSIRYCKLMELDGTSTSVSQDKDGKMSEWTFWDKDRKPLLKVKETKKSIQYLKMGSDKKWHVLPGIKDDFGKLGTAGLDKLKKMTPEEVDKLLKGRGQKVIPAPAPKEQLPLPPVFDMVKPIYEAENYHSLTNNVPQSVNIDRR
ncbi:MAG: hypothetical protein IKQ99_00420, partial [Alphaproteobacteria bacterium]|nr:hypothetical protein [Alphaproteobacteria bacterium]